MLEELLLLLLPPHAVPIKREPTTSIPNMEAIQRLRFGSPSMKKPANIPPPVATNQSRFPKGRADDDFTGITFAAVVVIVKVEVALPPDLLRPTEVGLSEQPIVALLEAQVRATVPAKPLAAAAVTVEVPEVPADVIVAPVFVKE